MPYLKDCEVYALWKYLNGPITGRRVFQFQDLTAPNSSGLLEFMFLMSHFELWGVTLENPVFHRELYEKWYPGPYQKMKELLDAQVHKENTREAVEAAKKIITNEFNVKELYKYSHSSFVLHNNGMREYVEFGKDLLKRNRAKVGKFFDFYMDEFMNDRLDIDDTNFLSFERQKERLEMHLRMNQRTYGNTFIQDYKPRNEEMLSLIGKDSFLFIHSIAAFQKLGRIRVEKAWVQDDVPPERQTDDFKIKLTIIEPKKAPEHQPSKPTLIVSGKKGYLKFYKEGPRIFIGKIDTRKYRLIEGLIEPLGVAKNLDSVFEAIRDPKDDMDSHLKDKYTAPARQRDIIDYAMKELQKIKELQGRVSITYHHGGRTVALNLK